MLISLIPAAGCAAGVAIILFQLCIAHRPFYPLRPAFNGQLGYGRAIKVIGAPACKLPCSSTRQYQPEAQTVLHAPRHHVGHAEAVIELPAQLTRLRHFQRRIADEQLVSKADICLGYAQCAKILTKSA